MSTSYLQVARNGVWRNNIVFVQMLALCPLLAVTGTATNGLGMGLATTAVMVVTGLLVSVSRKVMSPQARIPAFVMIIALVVSLVEMMMNAWMHELFKVLGLFIPLIVTNCAILGRAEAFASKEKVLPAMFDGLMMGLGFTFSLVLLGAFRETIGSGTLFANASILLGDGLAFLELDIIPNYRGFLLVALPPGGFIVLGFLLAAHRLISKRSSLSGSSHEQENAESVEIEEDIVAPEEAP